ncbi:Cys-tRNA(Pro) deacylase [Alkalicoccobacillus murimartini]|uniref:Cys-tRNA(Pro)/Cys-tRNA(Cys) deacylase n=1 Tax=Alkalicoccobacillus murimartini TaxID=171685 RepID=A0ABT9YGX0_9BACI|nr:Cys-tRNA(Pro) deacylase [Alkalicoccobacillus murimartini]MDQ0207080.1 Cys-tRNA(Pro)/Cys-tRNA(Cys) deacylase [Alkalicoccobacillus murimartini]
MKKIKTNASRLLDQQSIAYTTLEYETKDGKIDGLSVAEKTNQDPDQVFKTLVTQGSSKQNYVFLVRVADELHLKHAAKAVQEKQLTMIPVKDILATTGYIRGGCSPIGMKRLFPTIIDETALQHDEIVISGGKVGIQLKLNIHDLIQLTNAKTAPISK